MRGIALAVAIMVCGCGNTNTEADGGRPDASDGAAETATGPCQPTFCSGHAGATFCSDFDESSPLSAWSSTSVSQLTGNAQIALTVKPSDNVSCPASLLAHASQINTYSTNPHAWAEEVDPAGGADVTLDLNVKLPSSVSGYFNTFVLTTSDRSVVVTLLYTLFYQKGFIWMLTIGDGMGNGMGQQVNPIVDQWTHMTLVVHFANPNGTAALTYEDTVVGKTTATLQGNTLPYNASPTPIILDVGINVSTAANLTGDADVAYDNVLLQVK